MAVATTDNFVGCRLPQWPLIVVVVDIFPLFFTTTPLHSTTSIQFLSLSLFPSFSLALLVSVSACLQRRETRVQAANNRLAAGRRFGRATKSWAAGGCWMMSATSLQQPLCLLFDVCNY